MAVWTFYDYVTLARRNLIREWQNKLPAGDRAKIDFRILQMRSLPTWSEKWVSKYRGTDEIYELRIAGNKVQYRPLGTYFGEKQFVILAGAIEKGGKIPKSVVASAETRLQKIRDGQAHVEYHDFDDD